MGSFSWLDCTNNSIRILNGVRRNVYALIPKEFGGGHLVEKCYEGYGEFVGQDIYDLVACWNRKYLENHPDHLVSTYSYSQKRVSEYDWYSLYSNPWLSPSQVVDCMCSQYKYFDWRQIGIDIACHDEDNASLPYPIKITYDKDAVYEECDPSPSDPNQGFSEDGWGGSIGMFDDDDDEETDSSDGSIRLSGSVSPEAIKRTEQVLIDNGIDPDEADEVLRAIGYTLLNRNLYPE